ncbi:MAG TPA: alpha-mannosidase [Candidatus Faecousia intestinigallinarum]|nr:alpha-mannosidase [Candidatus Faecousia intestinigallinarum]
MYFIDQRIQVICNQMGQFRTRNIHDLPDWEYKHGQFFRPEEAEASATPWEKFDCRNMHWYAQFNGSDQFEGKFVGMKTDFKGIPGEHYWFRSTITVPEDMEGESVWFKIHTQIEEWDDGKNPQFLVFVNGEVVQGADMHHREVLLREKGKAGEVLHIDIQAYTGTLHHEFNFLATLFTMDEEINHFYYDLLIPLQAFKRMEDDDKTRLDIRTVMNNAINMLDMRQPYSEAFYTTLRQAQAYLTENLYEKMGGHADVIATCIGHTHIDVAWWWTVAQTREKVVRSFATVLKLMEEYPNYKFMSSQPVLYYFLKQRYPELYAKIKERVAEGRWEVEGGMWLEADCNLTSGESLVRQFLYGKRFFREEFGRDNKILWLPDVFGYSGALPQIMKKSGVDYFMTTKLAWNQINKIPNDTFIWRGIDGSEVLTHLITTVDEEQDPKQNFFTTYNGKLHPGSIMGGWTRYQNKEINNDILISYGYGDGGGGPTRWMLETSKRMEKGVKGIPMVRQETARVYFDELNARVKNNPHLDTWEGEFYFEYHRGTYTSMARNKRGNRKSEFMMMDLELLGVLTGNYPAEEDTRLWRDIILLNQFHDILPGSSIAEVYDVTKVEYAQLAEEVTGLIHQRLAALTGEGDGVTVFNTLGFQRDDIVNLGSVDASALRDENGNVFPVQQTQDGAVAYLKDLPSKGYKTLAKTEAIAASPFTRTDDYHLETPFYSIVLDENGNFTSIFDKENDREVLKSGKAGNQFRLYEDKPIYFDNWDVDMYYTEKSWPVNDLVAMRWTEEGPVRTTLEVEYRCSLSTIRQKIHFYADSRRIDFENVVDWKEHQHLLKVEFPVDVHSDEATFDVQFGNVTRKTHTNTSWDKARFESCGQKWMDFSEGNYGVSLLNDCKYGHSINDGTVALTLIKCGVEPNPNADVEMHYFTYSLYPHAGTWKSANTVQESYNLNQPAYAVQGGVPGKQFSYASVEPRNVVLETVKQAEDGEGTVLRLYECENARTKTTLHVPAAAAHAYSTNLLEEVEEELPIVDGKVTFTIKPYEIKTILLR